MSKPKLILVHGMGQHTAESFKKEFNETCKQAFNLYPGYTDKSAEDYVDLVPVGYNDIFDKFRKQMADRSKPVLQRLGQIPGMGGDLTKTVKEIESIEKGINDDDFFQTHWLDVIFYRFTTLGENVRIRVGKAIAEAIATANGGSSQVHVLGHSLGTAVVHDTLAKLYSDHYQLGDNENLDVVMHKLGSLHMLANTSRVLESFVKVERSVVKPGPGGCVAKYTEHRHKLDPITWARPFDPTDNGNWISNDSWFFGRYQLIQPTSVTNQHGNTHSIKHYVFNPLVHLHLFETVFGISMTDKAVQKGHERFIDKTLGGVADNLVQKLSKLKEKNLESVKGVLDAATTLKDFVEKLGGQYDE